MFSVVATNSIGSGEAGAVTTTTPLSKVIDAYFISCLFGGDFNLMGWQILSLHQI